MFLLYHVYVYLEFLILACTIYILAPDEIEVKYKIAVTVMELRFWLKDCESPI